MVVDKEINTRRSIGEPCYGVEKHLAKLSSDNVGNRPSAYSAFRIVSVTYCVTNYPHISELKITHIDYLTVSSSQEGACGLPGASG